MTVDEDSVMELDADITTSDLRRSTLAFSSCLAKPSPRSYDDTP